MGRVDVVGLVFGELFDALELAIGLLLLVLLELLFEVLGSRFETELLEEEDVPNKLLRSPPLDTSCMVLEELSSSLPILLE